MHQIALPALEAVMSLNPCQAPPLVPIVTTVAPVPAHQALYVVTPDCLYALNAVDGTARWCQQVKLTRTRVAPVHPMVSSPPPPRIHFATPRVVHDVVYVCAYGFGDSHTCAFTASDGTLRWWTPTDASVAGMPFMDWAVPQVRDGIVYSGTYALNARDGTVLWRIAIDTREEGTVGLPALADETLFATTTRGIYAINAQNGQIRWRYQPEEPSHVSGPPAVSGRLLYAGTNGLVGYPPKGHFFALEVETGTEVWRYRMGSYIGAVVQHGWVYVSSGDRFLYALDAQSGVLRWRQPFAAPGQYLRDPATIANDVLFINADGPYALSSEDDAVLWHESLENSPSVSFRQPVVLDGAVYLVRLDKRGGVLYALDARTGAECWHTLYPSALALATAQ